MAPPSLTKNAIEEIGFPDSQQPLSISLEASTFVANGHPILTQVPQNIISTPSPSPLILSSNKNKNTVGCFVGFDANEPRSHHVMPIGKLIGIRFMSIFRFKVWWTTHWVGNSGKNVEHETQMMILDKNETGRPYVLLLPVLEKSFRASLNPGVDDDVDIRVESGSTKVRESKFRFCLYMHAGDDPYSLVNDAMKVIRVHLGTFKLLEEKTTPDIVDKFGWCTWDAFYINVHPKGILEGVKGLVEGGCPPGLVLIDDGWQSTCRDEDDPTTDDQEGTDRTEAGEQMPCRLIKFEENYKFREMGSFIKELKKEFTSIKNVYVWHALCGYWGGIRPNVPGLPQAKIIAPKLSEGLKMTMEDLAVDKIVSNGVGLVPLESVHEMYEGLHSHLESVGIDGVKVDVIQLLEMVSEDFGGRVELAKAYYKALTASVKKHFKGNGVIASMQHSNDFMFLGTETIALGRVGDDFWCNDPSGDPNGTYWLQGCHMVHCAYNSLWMGNFIQPDWDMFQSTHPCAQLHAASRAISGGPVYVSDSVGNHNFKLLRRLVLPDGSILRCRHYALPTKDCLFEDPLHDGKTMLKIWNLNKYTGVLGLFNCQGGGWCPISRRIKSANQFSLPVTCLASPKDIEWNRGKNPIPIKGVNIFAVYRLQEKKLNLLKSSDSLEISLKPLNYELLVVSPVIILPRRLIQFAPIGLVNMLNSGGAIQSLAMDDNENLVRVGVKGRGEMRVFASEKPVGCKIDGVSVEFRYDEQMVMIQVPWPNCLTLSVVEYSF
ncbi:galactinol--sucrose galactosyltransferase-like [Mercurialis annua]|uniref:galactinol--sucrose galactosyltransferase-like n=1 Tax=Mercurialis annua TaxID=3986 RepID=UPI00216027B7|nr:galactinol--sucrose galactosyltransferase-like [Mercurialis annua]